jgi:hypothetical protein
VPSSRYRLPGVILVGTSSANRVAVCHGRRPAIVIDVTDQQFDRLVVTMDNPAAALALSLTALGDNRPTYGCLSRRWLWSAFQGDFAVTVLPSRKS